MEKRIGTVLISVEDRNSVQQMNEVISRHSQIIIGRQGLPRYNSQSSNNSQHSNDSQSSNDSQHSNNSQHSNDSQRTQDSNRNGNCNCQHNCQGCCLSIISLILEGTTDEIGSLTGQLGRLQGIEVKSVLLKSRDNES